MSPRLSFHGAARAVTGSCFRLETEHGQILIDCGLFHGSKTEKELNYRAFPFSPNKIATVILTHTHIDHSGLLPKLVKAGFKGAIYATPATTDLAGVMLPDSAYIQEIEVEQLNKRNARRGRRPIEPIYSAADALASMAGRDGGKRLTVLHLLQTTRFSVIGICPSACTPMLLDAFDDDVVRSSSCEKQRPVLSLFDD